ncbi:MAG: hypothetical protein KIT83_20030 [Bryobacterales bacterium]|nr:hypothetical protein [Bryobacterales bacterium]
MKVVSFLIRIYSLLFHLLLSLFLLALAIVGYSSSGAGLTLGMAPWSGNELVGSLFALGLGGLLFVILAFKGAQRFLYMIWTLVMLYLLVNGYFLTSYRFSGPGEFEFALYLALGALLAFLGGVLLLRKPLFEKKHPK